jgi:hypothetical protein
MRIAILILCVASTAYADYGANHHLGDAGFIAHHGRPPTAGEEAERVHEHLVYVRELLGQGSATRPALATRRAELLAYLDEYIAAGITPKNSYVPWRSPVFIDADGRICAVGYLIERTAGRPAAEAIAREHRLDFLEDIAAASPDVRAWIAGSGFTLDELASIQPGYNGPDVQMPGGLDDQDLEDGPYEMTTDAGSTVTGTLRGRRMTGRWRVTDAKRHVIGSGSFEGGAGTWHSRYADGSPMAEGRFVANRPTGTWKFFHRSGRLAAEGTFVRGARSGEWTFFYDTDGAIPIARGRFKHGELAGTWRHFDASGTLLATASSHDREHRPNELHVVADRDGVTLDVLDGTPAEGSDRVESYCLGKECVTTDGDDGLRDDAGNAIAKVDGVWSIADCSVCDPSQAISHIGAKRAKRLDTIVRAIHRVRAPAPKFLAAYGPTADESQNGEPDPKDLVSILSHDIGWYMEWPQVDKPFALMFATMPGSAQWFHKGV